MMDTSSERAFVSAQLRYAMLTPSSLGSCAGLRLLWLFDRKTVLFCNLLCVMCTRKTEGIKRPALVHLIEESRQRNRSLRFLHGCDRLLSCGLCVRGAGDRFATADSFQCHRTSDGGVDFATTAGSAARRSGIQVSASRPPQNLLCCFGRGSRELGHRRVEITCTCANGECFLRTSHRIDPSRVFGLCDTAE